VLCLAVLRVTVTRLNHDDFVAATEVTLQNVKWLFIGVDGRRMYAGLQHLNKRQTFFVLQFILPMDTRKDRKIEQTKH